MCEIQQPKIQAMLNQLTCTNHILTFKLEPKQRITSACCAASAAPFQLSGCSRVPRSPKCTMVSLSSALQWGHSRPVPCLCRAVRSVTSNKRINSRAGEQEAHTCVTDGMTDGENKKKIWYYRNGLQIKTGRKTQSSMDLYIRFRDLYAIL